MTAKQKKSEVDQSDAAPETKSAVATVEAKKATLPSLTEELMNNLQGGDDFGREDLAIPFLRILQKLSPQVDEENPSYVKGAKPGDIINVGSGKVYKEGVVVIPVKYQRELNEWKPREKGGGLVAVYGTDLTPLSLEEKGGKVVGKNDKGRPVTKDGNELVESGTYYVVVFDTSTGEMELAVIAMTSTMFKASRAWNTTIQNLSMAKPDGSIMRGLMPFAGSYRLTSLKQSKDTYTWFTWVIQFAGYTHELPGGSALIKEASDFRKNIAEGKVKADVAKAGHDEEAVGEDVF